MCLPMVSHHLYVVLLDRLCLVGRFHGRFCLNVSTVFVSLHLQVSPAVLCITIRAFIVEKIALYDSIALFIIK